MSNNVVKTKRHTSFLWKIITPIFIGLLVVWILYRENLHEEAFAQFSFTWRAVAGVVLAILLWVAQNLIMAERYRMMTDREISFLGGVRVNFLTEFTTVATPAIIGGSSALFLFLSSEGIRTGKATAITISGLFLDHLCMTLGCIFVLLVILFGYTPLTATIQLSAGAYVAFLTITAITVGWTTILALALFYRPQWVARMICQLTQVRFLRRFARHAQAISRDLVVTSQEMSRKGPSYWLQLAGLSILAWAARFAIVIALIYGFSTMGEVDFVAYLRQVMIWMISMASPTPGGSGLAEYMFKVYYAEYFSSDAVALIVAVIWRMIGAYSYLIIGGVVLSYTMHRMGIKVDDEQREDLPPSVKIE